jgi:toxin ParE1/3/4
MRIEWMLFAVNDRETIFDYIEADSPRAAVVIDHRIEAQVELLINTPQIGRPGRIEGTRELIIRQTPYIAAYRVERNCVRILRVLHGAQQWPDEMESQREM